MTRQKDPHHCERATVSSGPCPAEVVQQSEGGRGRHKEQKKKEKRRRKKSTLNMKQSQHRRHFHCQIWALITISCRIAVQAHVNILITIFLFQKIIIIRLLILYGQVTQCNLCTYIVNYYSLTLLSLSSSFFNHSKSLYLLLTQESFNLKMGRFVYKEKAKNKTCWLI